MVVYEVQGLHTVVLVTHARTLEFEWGGAALDGPSAVNPCDALRVSLAGLRNLIRAFPYCETKTFFVRSRIFT